MFHTRHVSLKKQTSSLSPDRQFLIPKRSAALIIYNNAVPIFHTHITHNAAY